MSVKERWKGTTPIHYAPSDVKVLLENLLKSDERIKIAYIFGSRVKKDNPLSDIDIAIYTSKDFLWQDYYLLYGECSKMLHSDRLDLVWLNKTEPILSFMVIKTGKVMFFCDEEILNDFEVKAKKSFYDYQLYLKKREKERGIGL